MIGYRFAWIKAGILTTLLRRMSIMKDAMGEYSGTRDRKYPTYIPRDTKIEGFCTFSELKQRIERLETLLDQVCQQTEKTG
jgi:hypothetical protein